MPLGQRLRLGTVGGDLSRGGILPGDLERGGRGLPLGALRGVHSPPPAVTAGIGVGSPPLLDLLFMGGVVEAVEHCLCHELVLSFQNVDRGVHRTDLALQPLLFLLEPAQVGSQGRRFVGLAVEHLTDRRQPEAELAQEQDALQPNQRPIVVVAVAVRGDPARREQPLGAIVAQGAARGSGQPGDVLDRVVHLSVPSMAASGGLPDVIQDKS